MTQREHEISLPSPLIFANFGANNIENHRTLEPIDPMPVFACPPKLPTIIFRNQPHQPINPDGGIFDHLSGNHARLSLLIHTLMMS
jgi:hypothetical protein